MERLFKKCPDIFTSADMKREVANLKMYNYTERSIRIYLDGLVDAGKLGSQKFSNGGNSCSKVYFKKDMEMVEIKPKDCRVGNDRISIALCNKYCAIEVCDAYYKALKNIINSA